MSIVYKVTRRDLTTYRGYQWVVGEDRIFPGTGELCGPKWCHAYTSAALAVFRNPGDAGYSPYRLWRADGDIGATDRGLKVGVTRLRLIEELSVPDVSAEQYARFAVLVASAVYHEEEWSAWARSWLAGLDRSVGRAEKAERRARALARQAGAPGAAAAAGAAAATAAGAAAAIAAWAAPWAAIATGAAPGAAATVAWAAPWAAIAAGAAVAASGRRGGRTRVELDLDGIARSVLLPWDADILSQ